MVQIAQYYPIFEDNQVLTSNQLNELIAFLDGQNRLTRVYLTGMGICCGFKLEPIAGEGLKIVAGVGITSEGYLIHQGDCLLTKYRSYTPSYAPLALNLSPTIYELVTDDYEAEVEGNLNPITTDFLSDKVILLYLDFFDEDPESCFGKSCDELGIKRHFTIRKLALSRENADLMLQNSPCARPDWDHGALSDIALPRPLFLADGGESRTYYDLSQKYQGAIAQVRMDLERNLRASYQEYGSLLNPLYQGQNPFDKFRSLAYRKIASDWDTYLTTLNTFNRPQVKYFRIQYFYDFLKDLILAYREFREAARQLKPLNLCCPDTNCFPRHLMLGQANVTTPPAYCTSTPYRHHFQRAEFSEIEERQLDYVRALHRRLWLMVEQFDLAAIRNVDKQFPVKITPSREKSGPLARRSIPFYYRSKETSSTYPELGTLEAAWNIDPDQICEPVTVPAVISYENHEIDTSPKDPTHTPLDFDLDPFNFLRIEGHQGMSMTEAVTQLEAIRKAKNLSFDIRTAWIGSSGTLSFDPDPHLWADLQPQYNVWRNRFLFELKNLEAIIFRLNGLVRRDVTLSDLFDFDLGGVPAERATFFFQAYSRFWQNLQLLEEKDIPLKTSQDLLSMPKDQFALITFFNGVITTLSELHQLLPCELKDFSLSEWESKIFPVLKNFVEVYLFHLAQTARTDLQTKEVSEKINFLIDGYRILCAYLHLSDQTLQVLTETLTARISQINPDIALTDLLKIHPGIDHRAGVTPGNTFVLVYQGHKPRIYSTSTRIQETVLQSTVADNVRIPNIASSLKGDPLGTHLGPGIVATSTKKELPDLFRGEKVEQIELDDTVIGQLPWQYQLLYYVPEAGTVIADFTLPYNCCDQKPDLPEVCVEPLPLVLPLTGIVHCHLVDDPNEQGKKIRRFDPLRLRVMDASWDQDRYRFQLLNEPEKGVMQHADTDGTQPDLTAYRIYQYHPELVKQKDTGIMTDTFDYRIVDNESGQVVGESTITIFIPICEEAQDEVLPKYTLEVQLFYSLDERLFQELEPRIIDPGEEKTNPQTGATVTGTPGRGLDDSSEIPFDKTATVTVSGPVEGKQTGNIGQFIFKDLPGGNYEVRVENDQYWAKPVPYITGPKRPNDPIKIVMCRKQRILSGKIIDQFTRRPIGNATIQLSAGRVIFSGRETELFEKKTKAEVSIPFPFPTMDSYQVSGKSQDRGTEREGQYLLANIDLQKQPDQGFVFHVSHPDYETKTQQTRLICTNNQELDFELVPIQRTIQGRVVFTDLDQRTEGLNDIEISLLQNDHLLQETTTSGDSLTTKGSFSFTELKPGIYTIVVNRSAYFSGASKTVDLTRVDPESFEIVLTPLIVEMITGTVLLYNRGLAGASVRMEGLDKLYSPVKTERSGVFNFTNVPLYLQPEGGFNFIADAVVAGMPVTGRATQSYPTSESLQIIVQAVDPVNKLVTLEGTVTSSRNGRSEAVRFIKVFVTTFPGKEATTNKDGVFSINSFPDDQGFTLLTLETTQYERTEKTFKSLKERNGEPIILQIKPKRQVINSDPGKIDIDPSTKDTRIPSSPTDVQSGKIDSGSVAGGSLTEVSSTELSSRKEESDFDPNTKIESTVSPVPDPPKNIDPVVEAPDIHLDTSTESESLEEKPDIPAEAMSENTESQVERPIVQPTELIVPETPEKENPNITPLDTTENTESAVESPTVKPEEPNITETPAEEQQPATPVEVTDANEPPTDLPVVLPEKETEQEQDTSSSRYDDYMETLRKKRETSSGSEPTAPPATEQVDPDTFEQDFTTLPVREIPYTPEEISEGIRQRLELYIQSLRRLPVKDLLIQETIEAIGYLNQITENNSIRLNYRFGIDRDDLLKAIPTSEKAKKVNYLQALTMLSLAYLDKLAAGNVNINTGMGAFTLRETAGYFEQIEGLKFQEQLKIWIEANRHWVKAGFINDLSQQFKLS